MKKLFIAFLVFLFLPVCNLNAECLLCKDGPVENAEVLDAREENGIVYLTVQVEIKNQGEELCFIEINPFEFSAKFSFESGISVIISLTGIEIEKGEQDPEYFIFTLLIIQALVCTILPGICAFLWYFGPFRIFAAVVCGVAIGLLYAWVFLCYGMPI